MPACRLSSHQRPYVPMGNSNSQNDHAITVRMMTNSANPYPDQHALTPEATTATRTTHATQPHTQNRPRHRSRFPIAPQPSRAPRNSPPALCQSRCRCRFRTTPLPKRRPLPSNEIHYNHITHVQKAKYTPNLNLNPTTQHLTQVDSDTTVRSPTKATRAPVQNRCRCRFRSPAHKDRV